MSCLVLRGVKSYINITARYQHGCLVMDIFAEIPELSVCCRSKLHCVCIHSVGQAVVSFMPCPDYRRTWRKWSLCEIFLGLRFGHGTWLIVVHNPSPFADLTSSLQSMRSALFTACAMCGIGHERTNHMSRNSKCILFEAGK